MKARRLIAAAAAGMLAASGVSSPSPAQQGSPAGAQSAQGPGPWAGGPGFYIKVPHSAGDVYVPLDATLRPMAPAREPALPPTPGSPASPPLPAIPSSPEWASLTVDMEFPAARVRVDGRELVSPGSLAVRPLLLVLAPGRHRIEILHAGSTLLSADIEVEPGRAYLIRWPIVPSGGTAVDDARRGGGYQVVPRP